MDAHPADFQVFVKPVGARCNLRCRYCYYLGKEDLYPRGLGTMSHAVLERYISLHLEAAGDDNVMFSWHGGEPTLAGPGFFRDVVAIQKEYKRTGQNIVNGIQTNATLLNEEWCEFLAGEGFVVGVSMDGPEHIHDLYRRNRQGRPGFEPVMKGLKMLGEYKVPCEVLCVVHNENVLHPLEVYRFFKALGVAYLTFLPLVAQRPGLPGGVSPESVPAGAFGEFLVTVFEEWKGNDIGRVKVQVFEEALRTAFGQEHTLCIFRKTCGRVPVVEHNGDFYSCDHFVDPGHLIGNIHSSGLSELLEHPRQVAFGQAKRETLPRYCRECEVLDMCNGECPKNRFIMTPDGEPGLNYLCEGYRLFFSHCRPFVDAVSKVWGGGR